MITQFPITILKKLFITIMVASFSYTCVLAADKSIGWKKKYEQTSRVIRQKGIDNFGRMLSEQLKQSQPKKLDQITTEISSKYHPSTNTLVTLIQLKRGFKKIFHQMLGKKAKQSKITIGQLMRIGKLSLVCKNAVNRSAIDQGMVFYYEFEDSAGNLVASAEANKSNCIQLGL